MHANARTFALTGVVALAVAVSLTACGPTAKVGDPAPSSSAAKAPAAGKTEATAAATTAPPAEPVAEVGTRANPAAIGQVVTISQAGVPQWEVSLSAPSLDATAAVAAANQFNEAAPEGMVYAQVTVNVKRLADEAATPWIDLTVEFVSAAGTTHAEYDHSVSVDGTLTDLGEMYAPATGSGLVTIAIPVADAAAGTWTVSSMFGDPTFFKAV